MKLLLSNLKNKKRNNNNTSTHIDNVSINNSENVYQKSENDILKIKQIEFNYSNLELIWFFFCYEQKIKNKINDNFFKKNDDCKWTIHNIAEHR